LPSGGDVAPPDPAQLVAADGLRRQARPWVIVLAVLLSLTCFGLLIGVPLLITELKPVPVGTRPRNVGWLIAGGVYLLLVIVYMANMPRLIRALPPEPVATAPSPSTDTPSPAPSHTAPVLPTPSPTPRTATAPVVIPKPAPPSAGGKHAVPWLPSEKQYLTETTGVTAEIRRVTLKLVAHYRPPVYTESSLTDETWRNDLAMMLVMLDTGVAQGLRATIEVPSTRLEDYNIAFEAAMQEAGPVPEMMTRAIDTLDPALQRQAFARLRVADTKLKQATALLETAKYQPAVLIDYD